MNYINSYWLNDLVKLLTKYDIEIKLSNTHLQPIQRENDSFITEQILTHSSSLTTIKKLRAYRLYLQVTLLSDIITLKGDTLLTTSLQGIRENQRTSAYVWPHQQRPNAHSWKLWQTILRKSIALHPVLSSNNPLV